MDSNIEVNFSDTDKLILQTYKTLSAGLAEYLGEGCEIVLHSLENLEQSVIAIFNGQHTGRRVGSPVTDLALQMLSRIEEGGQQDFISYFNRNKNGEPLKSTTIVIRGEHDRVIGLLCMNYYLNTSVYSLIQNWGGNEFLVGLSPTETLASDSDDLIKAAIENAQELVLSNSNIAVSNRNKEIVALLSEKGIFKLKDSVSQVADSLSISKNTVYLHMRNMNK